MGNLSISLLSRRRWRFRNRLSRTSVSAMKRKSIAIDASSQLPTRELINCGGHLPCSLLRQRERSPVNSKVHSFNHWIISQPSPMLPTLVVLLVAYPKRNVLGLSQPLQPLYTQRQHRDPGPALPDLPAQEIFTVTEARFRH